MIERLKRPIRRYLARRRWWKASDRKLNLGCGRNRQEGYLNVDVRAIPGVDMAADMKKCVRVFENECNEVYLSHVVEHFGYPGKAGRNTPDTVLGFLQQIHQMLRPSGVIRVAVPDFAALAKLYIEGKQPLSPRLAGRLCGEQDYPENLHKCLFDYDYLKKCLEDTGFTEIQKWDPRTCGLSRDSSFDELDGISTSLNLMARKTK
ncbi:methyltransferase domain-containing protein [uncultured Pseudodesulfovibrio sp.]|jgi:predicted SAM-dependent methyltransferase|uniref:class I SAM-dependent methyltransferase n=1 Tax=uncultured Pseudodesulfovibrio sp. TaxID=2035858 RepID=UPI0029C9AD4F|nr:methyltransferase domain-containing protein [uncultured Pseudodesulfovibrio sp.]